MKKLLLVSALIAGSSVMANREGSCLNGCLDVQEGVQKIMVPAELHTRVTTQQRIVREPVECEVKGACNSCGDRRWHYAPAA